MDLGHIADGAGASRQPEFADQIADIERRPKVRGRAGGRLLVHGSGTTGIGLRSSGAASVHEMLLPAFNMLVRTVERALWSIMILPSP